MRASSGHSDLKYVFPDAWRRHAFIYSAIMIVGSGIVSLGHNSPRDYIRAMVVCAGLFTIPAIANAKIASTIGPRATRRSWEFWHLGTVSFVAWGFTILVIESNPPSFLVVPMKTLSVALFLSVIPLWSRSAIDQLRRKSGSRLLMVDLIDVLIATLVVMAPIAALIWPRLHNSHFLWIVGPMFILATAMPAGAGVSLLLALRASVPERKAYAPLILSGIVATFVCWLNVAEILDNFQIPAWAVISTQSVSLAAMMMFPLFEIRNPTQGLSRLSPQAQVRRWNFVPVLAIAGMGVLIVEALSLKVRDHWIFAYALIIQAALIVLAIARHSLMSKETRNLYLKLERAAEDRKKLISDLISAVEDDRHRMASQLHELAVGSLVTLGSVVQASAMESKGRDSSTVVTQALSNLRADFATRAELLRQLMNAIAPTTEIEGSLATAIAAGKEGIFGDSPTPQVTIEIDPSLDLDWTTKTIVHRIVSEALENVHAHARASKAMVSVAFEDDHVHVRVSDDGQGFQIAAVRESGISSMRMFAGLGRGRLNIRSSPQQGTLVHAVLGEESSSVSRASGNRSGFQLIKGG